MEEPGNTFSSVAHGDASNSQLSSQTCLSAFNYPDFFIALTSNCSLEDKLHKAKLRVRIKEFIILIGLKMSTQSLKANCWKLYVLQLDHECLFCC